MNTTRSLLGYGVIAGPIYLIVGFAQALTRPGFDVTQDAWSKLCDGHLGWIQITNFIATGLMTVAAAVGLGRARHTRPAPILVGVYGASLVGAGIFTPGRAPALHFGFGGVGFLGLIVACFLIGGRFSREGHRPLAWFSRITGVVFLAGFAGIASGSHGPTTVAFLAAVIVVWTWLSTVSVFLYLRLQCDAARPVTA
jgi:hypothetical membrane protein